MEGGATQIATKLLKTMVADCSAPGHQNFHSDISALLTRASGNRGFAIVRGTRLGTRFDPGVGLSLHVTSVNRAAVGFVATLIALRSGMQPDAAAPHALLIATTRASGRGRATRSMMACTTVPS